MTLKKNFKYKYYSCLDSKLSSTQPEQHYLCNLKAKKEKGQIVFYGSEEYSVREDQPYILHKLKKTKGIDGVIFFTFDQFCYSENFNLKLLYEILNKKKSIHFSREDISIYKKNDLDEYLPCLIAYHNAFHSRNNLSKEILSII